MKHNRSLVLKKYGLNPHPYTTKQLNKMTKKSLVRLVIKFQDFIVRHAYEMYKAKLPRLKVKKLQESYKRKKKLKAGIHTVTINGKKRKVKVLKTGQWRFLKG